MGNTPGPISFQISIFLGLFLGDSAQCGPFGHCTRHMSNDVSQARVCHAKDERWRTTRRNLVSSSFMPAFIASTRVSSSAFAVRPTMGRQQVLFPGPQAIRPLPELE